MRELGAVRFVEPMVDVRRLVTGSRGYVRYFRDLRRYRRMVGSDERRRLELYPQTGDWLPASPFDAHYFFQDVWAAREIAGRRPEAHVDVGSRVDLVGFLTAVTRVTFVDIRPLTAELPNLRSVRGSVLDMPFASRSIHSLSCLHVAEHIGLGRYGDPLDPEGTRKAAAELQRVLAVGGQLLFSGPVGRPRVCFNAHRIHAPEDIVAMFPELQLESFGGIDDGGSYHQQLALADLADARYACGLFRFSRGFAR